MTDAEHVQTYQDMLNYFGMSAVNHIVWIEGLWQELQFREESKRAATIQHAYEISKLKSAFVLDLPSGQEKIVCGKCSISLAFCIETFANHQWFTPVTLTCSAVCSSCGEGI